MNDGVSIPNKKQPIDPNEYIFSPTTPPMVYSKIPEDMMNSDNLTFGPPDCNYNPNHYDWRTIMDKSYKLDELDDLAKDLANNPKKLKKLARFIQDHLEEINKEDYTDDWYKAYIAKVLGIEKEHIDKKLIIDL